jgi:hypothetical protein
VRVCQEAVLDYSILRPCKSKEAMFALHLSRAMLYLKGLKVYHSCRRSFSNLHTAYSTLNTWLYSNNDRRSSRSLSTCSNWDFRRVRQPWESRRCRRAGLWSGCHKETCITLCNLRLDSYRSNKTCL